MCQSPIAEMKESKENEELKGNFEYDQNPIHLPRQDTGKTSGRLVLSRNLTRGVGIYTGFTQSDLTGEPPSGAEGNGVGNDLMKKWNMVLGHLAIGRVFKFATKNGLKALRTKESEIMLLNMKNCIADLCLESY